MLRAIGHSDLFRPSLEAAMPPIMPPCREGCHTYRPVHDSYAFSGETEPSGTHRVEQERIHHLYEEGLREPVQKHEHYRYPDISLPEESRQCPPRLLHYHPDPDRDRLFTQLDCPCRDGFRRKHHRMVYGDAGEDNAACKQGDEPGLRYVPGRGFEYSGNHHKHSLSEYGCKTVRSARLYGRTCSLCPRTVTACWNRGLSCRNPSAAMSCVAEAKAVIQNSTRVTTKSDTGAFPDAITSAEGCGREKAMAANAAEATACIVHPPTSVWS